MRSTQKSYRNHKEHVMLSSRILFEMHRSERPNELIGAFLKQLVWTDVLHICFTFICTCLMGGLQEQEIQHCKKNSQAKNQKKNLGVSHSCNVQNKGGTIYYLLIDHAP